jgi:hypothetical protein
MVNQYEYVTGKGNHSIGSFYNYWNSGKDGQQWDCINIIGLSETPPFLKTKSPIWNCSINGLSLNITSMDHAYIDMIQDWWEKPTPDLDYIEKAHRRVHEGFYVKSSDRDSSKN